MFGVTALSLQIGTRESEDLDFMSWRQSNLLSMLTNSVRFEKDENFKNLNPIYDIEAKDIEKTIKSFLK